MYLDTNRMMSLFLLVALMASSEAFFLKWGSDSSQASQQKWVQPMSPNMAPFRYQYAYSPYDSRKIYQIPNPGYAIQNQDLQHLQNMQSLQNIQLQQSLAPIPINVPAGASLTPVSLQHVQLVPCMCPVAPEEADKLHDQLGPGPYVAQTYQPAYSTPQQIPVDNTKSSNNQ